MTSLVGDSYIDMGSNNDGGCDSGSQNGITSPSGGVIPTSTPSTTSAPSSTTLAPTTTTAWSGSSIVDCSVVDGLFPDPNNCRGFIKCAQVKSMFEMFLVSQIFRSGGSLELTMSVRLICKIKVNYNICLISNSKQDQTCKKDSQNIGDR